MSSIKLGNIDINKIYSNSSGINKIYLGDTLTYGGEEPTSPGGQGGGSELSPGINLVNGQLILAANTIIPKAQAGSEEAFKTVDDIEFPIDITELGTSNSSSTVLKEYTGSGVAIKAYRPSSLTTRTYYLGIRSSLCSVYGCTMQLLASSSSMSGSRGVCLASFDYNADTGEISNLDTSMFPEVSGTQSVRKTTYKSYSGQISSVSLTVEKDPDYDYDTTKDVVLEASGIWSCQGDSSNGYNKYEYAFNQYGNPQTTETTQVTSETSPSSFTRQIYQNNTGISSISFVNSSNPCLYLYAYYLVSANVIEWSNNQ